MAQKYRETLSGSVFRCLQKKWPDIKYDGHYAFVPETGQNLAWDNDKNAWVDVKTRQPVWGDCKNLTKALFVGCLQDKWPDTKYDGHYAFVPETGQNLAWDKDKHAWIDTKTGKCICPECPPSRTAQQSAPSPTPSTSSKVTNVLRTIGSSVSIGIGGGGIGGGGHEHHDRVRGEDRHRTAEKVSTDKTKTHTTSPTTTHKTVTSACKCHPCTCSPCTCR